MEDDFKKLIENIIAAQHSGDQKEEDEAVMALVVLVAGKFFEAVSSLTRIADALETKKEDLGI